MKAEAEQLVQLILVNKGKNEECIKIAENYLQESYEKGYRKGYNAGFRNATGTERPYLSRTDLTEQRDSK